MYPTPAHKRNKMCLKQVKRDFVIFSDFNRTLTK